MKKRIILSAGGTGGHLFPAQSLAEHLSEYEIRFVAGHLSTSAYFDRESYRFYDIDTATFTFTNLPQLFKGSWKIVKGIHQAIQILNEFKPEVVVGFGSFFTLPILIGAVIKKIPIVLHEQNAIPGKVNRLFAPLAHTVAITFPSSPLFFGKRGRKKIKESLFPIRKQKSVSLEEAKNYFGLQQHSLPTLLIFGGSKGAARLNQLFLQSLSELPPLQILHFTGNQESAEAVKKIYSQRKFHACVKAFEPRMDLAMQAADCAIARAGAATICELIEFKLPALLAPYPFATDNHQEKNGDHFVSIVKGGIMYQEKELTPSLIAQSIHHLIEKKEEMKKQIAEYKSHNQAQPLYEIIKGIIT